MARTNILKCGKYFPRAVETIKGHMVQSLQGVQSTKKKTPPPRVINKETFKATQEEEEDMVMTQ